MIYTNIAHLPKLGTNVRKGVTIPTIVAKLKKATGIYLDTETCPSINYLGTKREFVQQFIKQYEKKVTKRTTQTAQAAYDEARKDCSLTFYKSEMRLLTLADESGNIYVLDAFQNKLQSVFTALKDKPVCGHNLKFDLKVIMFHYKYIPGDTYDTLMGHRMVTTGEIVGHIPGKLENSIYKFLNIEIAKGYGDEEWRNPITKEMFKYAIEDVKYLQPLQAKQCQILNTRSINKDKRGYWNKLLYDQIAIIESKFTPILVDAEMTGVSINVKALQKQERELEGDLYNAAQPFVAHNINTKSPIQLLKMLNDKYNVPVKSTAKGELLKYTHVSVVKALLNVKSLQKELQMVTDYLNKWMNKKHIIYADFNQIRAGTGRMSSRDPNLQQIKRSLKKIFYKAKPGRVYLHCDYPQIEARLMASIAGDQTMINMFKTGKDIHKEMAAKINNKPASKITDEERTGAKAGNFGLLFGMGAKTFVQYSFDTYQIDITLIEAERIRKHFFNMYKAVKELHNKNSYLLTQAPEITVHTILGRHIKVDRFTNANNNPVQGSGADMLKLASVRFYKILKEKKLDAHIINFVHDALVVDTSKKDYKKVSIVLKDAMEISANYMIEQFQTPVDVEVIK